MKRQELKELRQKNQAELKRLLREAQNKLAKMRIERKAGNIKDVYAVAKTQDEIAKIATIIHEKELAGGESR